MPGKRNKCTHTQLTDTRMTVAIDGRENFGAVETHANIALAKEGVGARLGNQGGLSWRGVSDHVPSSTR
eukprot:5701093-Pyramimonas_sp.AAC.1